MAEHSCINYFGEIETTIIEADNYWVVREYAECEECGKKYENFKEKIQKKKTLYGCQLHKWDWKEL